MNYTIRTFSTILLIIIGLSLISYSSINENSPNVPASENQELYTCGMHPNVIQEGPGLCPICGMFLTPVNNQSNDDNQDGVVKIDPVTVQNIGIRTTKVEKRDLNQKIRTIGRIDYNESQVGYVQTKYSGWVENIYFNETGQFVNKGDVLVDIYSPLLVSAQEEYLETYILLNAAKNENQISRIADLRSELESSKKRLQNFNISDKQIINIIEKQEIDRTVKLFSPYSGIINNKHIQIGMEVKPGMKLYSISDIKKLWVYADIYDFESVLVKMGNKAKMKLSYVPGKEYHGKIESIYPYIDAKSRTLKVRLEFPNKNNLLKPGMFANIEIFTEPIENAISIPTEAIIFSGERNIVFLSLGNGRFVPREVAIGLESHDGYYEIKEGLDESDSIVISSQFLLDSESKLQEGIANMLSNHAAPSEIFTDHSNHIH